MEEKRSFGEYLRKKRLELALTQKDLARRLYVTESTVSKWERGLSYPDVSLVTAICGELGISEHEFFAACDDHQAHAQEKAARRWKNAILYLRRFFAGSYAAAIIVCFICDLAVYHTLDWFWIVLTAVGLGACFTDLPFLVRRNRLPVCLAAATGCLILLLVSCWHYVGGHWLGGGICIVAVSLALPWGVWAIWRFYGKDVVFWSTCLASFWFFALLTVIWVFAGGDWLLDLGYPLAAVGVLFGWAYLGCFRYLPAGRPLKVGIGALLTSVTIPIFNGLCTYLIPDQTGPGILEYFSVRAMLVRRFAGDFSWINMLLFQLLLLSALFLLTFGLWTEIKRRKE